MVTTTMTVLLLAFTVIMSVPAVMAVKVGLVAYDFATSTYTIWPSGGDDTMNIQGAFDACAAYGPGCTVQLEKGTFHTAQIVVHDFQGNFLGMGERWTIMEALPDLPSPTSTPFWIALPSSQNPWPDMFTFINGEFTISGITFTDPYELPTRWIDPHDLTTIFHALGAVIMITGEHADVVVDHVTLLGAKGDFYGTNMINGIYYQGILLPPGWTDYFKDCIPLTGTFMATSSTLYKIVWALTVENLAEAQVTFRFNTIDSSQFPLSFYDVSDSVLDISGNRASNVFGGAGVLGEQALFKSGLLPSQGFITDNEFHIVKGPRMDWCARRVCANGVLLLEDGAASTLDAVVSHNDIYSYGKEYDQSDPSFALIYGLSMRSLIVTQNEIYITSPGRFAPSGVAITGGPGDVESNDIRGSYVGVWVDNAASVQVKGNEIRDSGMWGIAVTSASGNNRIVQNTIIDSGQFDLYWDQTGSGNVWMENHCHTSYPTGLCTGQ